MSQVMIFSQISTGESRGKRGQSSIFKGGGLLNYDTLSIVTIFLQDFHR